MFAGLGWKKEIRSLGDLDVPYTPLPERDIRAGKQYNDDYDLTPFLQSTQPGGGGCRRSRNNMRKMKRRERCA
jgi:hypothetical protein